MRGSLYLPAGYIKCNGATVQRADYPRLVALAERHNLWTDDVTANAGLFGRGDGAATMVLPNWTERMVQLARDNAGASVAAGLPNITGTMFFRERLNGIPSSGVFNQENTPANATYHTPGDGHNTTVFFDASRANLIYGRSNTVQPAAIRLISIIRY